MTTAPNEHASEHHGADVHPDRSGGAEIALREREWLLRRQIHETETMTNEMPTEVPATEKKRAGKKKPTKTSDGGKAPAKRAAGAVKAKAPGATATSETANRS